MENLLSPIILCECQITGKFTPHGIKLFSAIILSDVKLPIV